MSDARMTPDVVAYRVEAIETKVTAINIKLDELRDLVMQSACPQPGACIGLGDSLKRLESIVEKHENAIQEVRTDITSAKAGAKAISSTAAAVGACIGAVASLVIQYLQK